MPQQYCFWNFHCTKAILNWIEMNWIGKILCYNSQPCTAVIVINQLNKLLALQQFCVCVFSSCVSFPCCPRQWMHSLMRHSDREDTVSMHWSYLCLNKAPCSQRKRNNLPHTDARVNVSIHLQMFFLDLNTECIQFVLNTLLKMHYPPR